MLTYDFRCAVRLLKRNPAFTAMAVLTLALGIGASTAVFSVFYAVMLRPLPYPEPHRLVRISETSTIPMFAGRSISVSPRNFLDWSESGFFQDVGGWVGFRGNLTGVNPPEQVFAARVTPSLLSTLGVRPAIGRNFTLNETQPGQDNSVILSHALWMKHFGGTAQAIGRPLTFEGKSYTIVGVMPAEFRWPDSLTPGSWPALLAPLAFDAKEVGMRGEHSLTVIARLKPESSVAAAHAKVTAMAQAVARENREYERWGAQAAGLADYIVGHTRTALFMLALTVLCILLIACANVTNLMLARGAKQTRELAVRAALGASRGRLVRMLLAQSIVLALAGGAAGVLLALWGTDVLLALAPRNIPRLDEVHIDLSVLAVTFALSVGTGLLVGLIPAMQLSRTELQQPLRDAGASGTQQRSRIGASLIVAEVALSVLLLAGAALLIRSMRNLHAVDTGVHAERVLLANVAPPQAKYGTPQQRAAFFVEVLSRVKAIPGVLGAAAVNHPPLAGSQGGNFSISGKSTAELGNRADAEFRLVSPEYFYVLGMTVLEGRVFTAGDTDGAPPVAVVNRTFARRFLPGQNVIGQRVKRGDADSPLPWLTVVGIVGDVRHEGAAREPYAEVFVPYLQFQSTRYSPRELVIRATGNPMSLLPAIQAAVSEVDPEQPVSRVRTLDEVFDRSIADRRFNTLLLSIFGGLGLLLTLTGLYGVLSYLVAQRTKEIGIRMAIGAQPDDVLRMVLGRGAVLVALGSAVGVAAALAVTRAMRTLLFGVTPTDPASVAAAVIVLAVTALLACYVPARRAAHVDPITALRYE